MRIAGIDPGLRVTGYGVIDFINEDINLVEAGVIKTTPKESISVRLKEIHDGVMSLFEDAKPNHIVLEKLYSDYRHPTTALLMGHARGVICLAAGEHNIPLVNIPSTRVKKAVVSNGHATKLQVNRAVQGILSLKTPLKPLDVSDALAIAISYAWMGQKTRSSMLDVEAIEA